jgi:hypothetical protein
MKHKLVDIGAHSTVGVGFERIGALGHVRHATLISALYKTKHID